MVFNFFITFIAHVYLVISLPPINLSYTKCTDDEELVQLMCAFTPSGKTINWPC